MGFEPNKVYQNKGLYGNLSANSSGIMILILGIVSMISALILIPLGMVSFISEEVISEFLNLELQSYVLAYNFILIVLMFLSLVMSVLTIVLYAVGKRKKLDIVGFVFAICAIAVVCVGLVYNIILSFI